MFRQVLRNEIIFAKKFRFSVPDHSPGSLPIVEGHQSVCLLGAIFFIQITEAVETNSATAKSLKKSRLSKKSFTSKGAKRRLACMPSDTRYARAKSARPELPWPPKSVRRTIAPYDLGGHRVTGNRVKSCASNETKVARESRTSRSQ